MGRPSRTVQARPPVSVAGYGLGSSFGSSREPGHGRDAARGLTGPVSPVRADTAGSLGWFSLNPDLSPLSAEPFGPTGHRTARSRVALTLEGTVCPGGGRLPCERNQFKDRPLR